jgi:NAD(P)-dependent dehydrogenase (short-subunit alcohol dehydrogenase family)
MNKIIFVTGAGRGLGFSIVKRHLTEQDKIYALDWQLTDEVKALARDHDLLHIYQCDISSDEAVTAAVQDILAAEDHVDIIYNVAGIYLFEERVGLAQTHMDQCLRMYNINALGALRVCQGLLPLIKAGTLVMNISSEAGSIGASRRKEEYGYCMSKAAMNMSAKLLSNELWGIGARVMSIHPGWLRTVIGGPGAAASSHSIAPDDSAADIVRIALNIDQIPRDQMFMEHTGQLIQW